MNKIFTLLIGLLVISNLQAQSPELWGTTLYGGENGKGTVYKLDGTAENRQVVHSFDYARGSTPKYGKICLASDGLMYGLTNDGGEYNKGVFFKYDTLTSEYTDIFDFDGAAHGANPYGGVIEASNGKFYGMTYNGGANDYGVLFEYDPVADTLINKFDFDGNLTGPGGNPYGSLLEVSNGILYGVTFRSEASIFEYNISTELVTTKHYFEFATGSTPLADLLLADNGKLYGVTNLGGANSSGVVYEFDIATNTYDTIYSFIGDEQATFNPLMQASNGKLYGVSDMGGATNGGTLYEVDITTNTFTIIYSFISAQDHNPIGQLIQVPNGKLYGIARNGGSYQKGMIYEFDLSTNTFTPKKYFNGNPTGEYPLSSLIMLDNGNLLTTASDDGWENDGVIIQYNYTTNDVTKVLDFGGSPQGKVPKSGLVEAPNGKLYGMTDEGGQLDKGVIFEIDPITGKYTKKMDIDWSTMGTNTQGQMFVGNDGLLYGNFGYDGLYSGAYGSIFKYDPDANIFTQLHAFTTTIGYRSVGDILQAADGNLYGTTSMGGTSFIGSIYKYDMITSTASLLFEFDGPNYGKNPYTALIEADNGFLYGTTYSGGVNDKGIIFKFDRATNTLTNLFDFDGANNGASPYTIMKASNGKLYGVTRFGGALDDGVLFEFDIVTNTFTKKMEFDDAVNGSDCQSRLMEASNGKIYGYNRVGGPVGVGGVVFEYDFINDIFIVKQSVSDALEGIAMINGYLIETNFCYNTKDTINIDACDTYTVPSGDETYTTLGSYMVYDTLLTSCGMDSVLVINLNLGQNNSSTDVQIACDSYTWIDGNTYYVSTNSPTFTLTNSTGCDSIVTLDLTINYSSSATDVITACDSYTWIDGTTYTASNNTEAYVLTNSVGCDSLVTLDLTINYSSISTDVHTACEEYTWIDGLTYYASTNTPTYTLTNTAGCDSIVTLDLTIEDNCSNFACQTVELDGIDDYLISDADVVYETNDFTIEYWVKFKSINASNFLVSTRTSGKGSRSSRYDSGNFTFAYYDGAFHNIVVPYAVNVGDWYHVAYQYDVAGNEMIIYINGEFITSETMTGNPAISGATTVLVGGRPNNLSTVTDAEFEEIRYWNYIRTQSEIQDNKYSTLSGNEPGLISYWNMDTTNTTIIYDETANHIALNLINGDGTSVWKDECLYCYTTSSSITVTECDTYTAPSGNYTWTNSGMYSDTILNSAGCDSIISIDLTINYSNTGTDVQTACETFTWIDANTYTASTNSPTFTLTNANGCDSLVTLDLTINYNTTGVDVITACDTYTWIDGVEYTASNNSATHTLTSALGCDSVVTLNLTINNSTTGIDVVTACDTYTWIDGVEYTSSTNSPTFTLTNSVGCDSVVTLNLTINNSTTGVDVQTACDSFTWIDGVEYTSDNNSATYTLTNSVGCDSVVTLNLTINNTEYTTDVQSACETYTWIDGNTYTSSTNSPTYTLTSVDGCDSIVTLDLTIYYPTTGVDVQTACISFTWIDGNTYTTDNNTATHTLTASTGCDSVVTLDLTIVSAFDVTDYQTACEQYTWIDGNTYYSSTNTPTYTLISTQGCDSVITLDLTVNYSNTGTDIQTSCDSFTWIDGVEYTSNNNSATYTLTNSNGCDSIVTLDLTVNYSTSGIDAQTACNSYTWIDGIEYTSDNNSATFTLTNSVGCDSVVTLNLTINTVDNSVSLSGNSITANAIGATYQWLDCNNNNAIIPSETSQSFTATSNGDYAVEVSENSCIDTSVCINIVVSGTVNANIVSNVSIYPNPTNKFVNIDLGSLQNVSIKVTSVTGKIVYTKENILEQIIQLELNDESGIYFIQIISENETQEFKVVKY